VFIDVGYLLQTPSVRSIIAPRACEPTGIFVVPLAGTTRGSVDTRASAYAALRELNHFSDHNTTYEVLLPDTQKFSTTEPPFAFTFLLSTKGQGGTDLTPRQLVELIGQTVFLECTSNFFKQVKANRINIQAQMSENDGRGCNQNFLTLGIATLEIPAIALANAASARLVAAVFGELRYGRWADRPGDFKLVPTAAAAAMARHGLTFEEVRKRLATVDGDKTMEQVLDGRLNLLSTLAPAAQREEVLKLEKEMEANILSPEGAGATPGAWAAAVRQNASNLQSNVGKLLDDMVSTMVVSPDERLLFALNVLKEAKTVCDRDLAQATQIYDRARAELDLAKRKRDQARSEFVKMTMDPLLRFSLWHRYVCVEFVERYYGVAARKYYEKAFNILVCKQAIDFLERMKRDVDSSLARAVALDNYLGELMEETKRKAKTAETAFQPVNGVLLGQDEAGMGKLEKTITDVVDKTLGTGDVARDRLGSFVREHLESMLFDESHHADAFKIQKRSTVDQDRFLDYLLVAARELVMKQGGVGQMSALDEFYAHSLNHVGELARIKSLSEPYLPLDRSALYYNDSPVKHQRMVGLQTGNSSTNSVNTFKKQAGEVDASLSGVDGANRFVELEDAARIIWYSEYGAFPLRLWPHLEPMHTQYEAHLHKKELPIHNRRKDFEWLDITKPAPEDKARARRVFLASNIPGMEIFSQQNGEYTFRWRDEADLETVESFTGDLERIVDRLCKRADLLQILEERLQTKRASVGDVAFADAFRAWRNQIVSELPPAKAKGYVEPIDEYMKLNGLTDLLRAGKGPAPETAVPTFGDKKPAKKTGKRVVAADADEEEGGVTRVGALSLPALGDDNGAAASAAAAGSPAGSSAANTVAGSAVGNAAAGAGQAGSADTALPSTSAAAGLADEASTTPVCGQCGNPLRPEARFCDGCGASRA
jgi:hypothetical protein